MQVGKVVERIRSDPAYAQDLLAKFFKLGGVDGVVKGPGKDQAWREMLADFAESPEELNRLMAVNATDSGSTWWTTTVGTIACTTATPGAYLTVTTIVTITTAGETEPPVTKKE